MSFKIIGSLPRASVVVVDLVSVFLPLSTYIYSSKDRLLKSFDGVKPSVLPLLSSIIIILIYFFLFEPSLPFLPFVPFVLFIIPFYLVNGVKRSVVL